MKTSYNFFFFIEIHYLNTELFDFIKTQLKINYNLNITTNLDMFDFYHFKQGNVAIIYGNVTDFNQFEEYSQKLIKTLNIYDGFISILNLLFIGNLNSYYWFTLDTFLNLKLKNQLYVGSVLFNIVETNLNTVQQNLINIFHVIQNK